MNVNNYSNELKETITSLSNDLYQLAGSASCEHYDHIARRLHIAQLKLYTLNNKTTI